MFPNHDPVVNEQVDTVYGLLTELGRGDVLAHDAIRAVLGVEPHEGRWDHVVGRARRRLLRENGIATWPEVTVGYRLLTVRETLTDLPARRVRKARSQVRRLRGEVCALPDGELSDHQLRRKAFLEDRVRDLKRTMRDEQRALAAILGTAAGVKHPPAAALAAG